MNLHATILTLFPELFPGPLATSVTGRALDSGAATLNTINIRDFAFGKHADVDDTPYGGGAGMVMRPDVIDDAIEAAKTQNPNATLIYFTPRGVPITQSRIAHLCSDQPHNNDAVRSPAPPSLDAVFASPKHFILLCGRFEAIDERVLEKHQPTELSLGDFVMTGGELAAMAFLDASIRLIPNVIGERDSLAEESFGMDENYACLLEYPHYSKPPIWQNNHVPDILLSGDHGKIAGWRKAQAEALTKAKRPDMWERYSQQKPDSEK